MPDQHSPQEGPEVWMIWRAWYEDAHGDWMVGPVPDQPPTVFGRYEAYEVVPRAALQDREAELERAETDGMLAILTTRERLAEAVARANRAEDALREVREKVGRLLADAEVRGEQTRGGLWRAVATTRTGTLGEVSRLLAALDTSIGDREPEEQQQVGEDCKRCGRGNVIWFAASPLWNAVMRDGSINGDPLYADMVCPLCFMQLAEEQGIAARFRVTAETVNVTLETTTPSGRVWDEEKFQWVEPPAPCSDRAEEKLLAEGARAEDERLAEERGEPKPDGGLAPEASPEAALREIDALVQWFFTANAEMNDWHIDEFAKRWGALSYHSLLPGPRIDGLRRGHVSRFDPETGITSSHAAVVPAEPPSSDQEGEAPPVVYVREQEGSTTELFATVEEAMDGPWEFEDRYDASAGDPWRAGCHDEETGLTTEWSACPKGEPPVWIFEIPIPPGCLPTQPAAPVSSGATGDDDLTTLRHERNFWRWKHSRREDEIEQLREELPEDSPNYLAPETTDQKGRE